MPSCCIVGCKEERNKYRQQITLHRFPQNQVLRKKWLEVIGTKNLNQRHKLLFVCSLHFEETCFNRTLDVIRLRDGSVPSLLLPLQNNGRPQPGTSSVMVSDTSRDLFSNEIQNQYDSAWLERRKQKPVIFEKVKVFDTPRVPSVIQNQQDSVCLESEKQKPIIIQKIKVFETPRVPIEIQNQQDSVCLQREMQKPFIIERIKVSDTPRDPLLSGIQIPQDLVSLQRTRQKRFIFKKVQWQAEKIKDLTKKYQILKKTIKNLKKKLHRRDQKIARFTDIIKIVKENRFSDGTSNCVGYLEIDMNKYS